MIDEWLDGDWGVSNFTGEIHKDVIRQLKAMC